MAAAVYDIRAMFANGGEHLLELLDNNNLDKNLADEDGKNLLHLLIENESICCNLYTVIEKLLDYGVDPYERDTKNGYTVLHYAMEKQLGMKIISLLLSRGNSLDVEGFDGKTPLDILSESLQNHHLEAINQNLGGNVVSFGKCDLQLGYTTEQIVQPTPRQVVFSERTNEFVFVSGARYHSVAITAEGLVYSWGQGKGGRLGQGDELSYILPTQIKGLSNRKIIKVACGRDHTLALCESGDVFSWGSDRYGQLGIGCYSSNSENGLLSSVSSPKRVKLSMKAYSPARDIAASSTHSIAVIENGQVYTWGSNDRGQLGYRSNSSSTTKRASPKVVDTFCTQGDNVVRCSICTAAEGVSCVATREGKVWQWGRGSLKPSRVKIRRTGYLNDNVEEDEIFETGWRKADESVKVVEISAGPNHVAAVSDYGEVYTWGTYADLLGHSNKGCDRTQASHVAVGTRVESLFKNRRKIISVSCAKRHTCAVDDIGHLWVWGHGDHGILGMPGDSGYETYQPSPSRVPSLRKVTHVSAADAHTIAVVGPFKPTFESMSSADDKYPAVELEKESEELSEELMFESDESSADEDDLTQPIDKRKKLFEPLSLVSLAEQTIASFVDTWNVLSTLNFAQALHASALIEYCNMFIEKNLDAVLVSCPGCESFLAEVYGCPLTEEGYREISEENINILNNKNTEIEPNEKTKKEIPLSMEEARKELKLLESKLSLIEDSEFRLSAVNSKAKKRDEKKKRLSIEKQELNEKIEFLQEKLGMNKSKKKSDKLASILKDVSNSNENLFCKLCQVAVPDQESMVEHVSGKRHRKMMARREKTSDEDRLKTIRPVSFSTPMKIPATRRQVFGSLSASSAARKVPCSNISPLPVQAQVKLSTSLSSSLDSNCSWSSSQNRGSFKQGLHEIMSEENQRKARKKVSSASLTSPICYSPGDMNIQSPSPSLSSSHRNSFSLSSFMKNSENLSPATPSAWSAGSGSSCVNPSPLRKFALAEIQNEQKGESLDTRSLEKSSWGYNTTQGHSLLFIQEEEERRALEKKSELLARQLAEEEEVKLKEELRRRKARIKAEKYRKKKAKIKQSQGNLKTQASKGKQGNRGKQGKHRKRKEKQPIAT